MTARPKTASLWVDRIRSDIDQFGFSRRVADRISWDLRRFGITPRAFASRVRDSNQPPLLCNSLPKAGTHLVERALCLHPKVYRRFVPTLYPHNLPQWSGLEALLEKQRAGELLVAHLPFDRSHLDSLERAGTRTFLVIRDPRDILVSNAFYISGYRAHNWHHVVAAQDSMKGKLRLLLEGRPAGPRIPGIDEYLERYAGWLDTSCLVVRYEDLVGERSRRLDTLERIYRHAEVPLVEGELASIGDELISPASPTFRSGAIGQWREHFDRELNELFLSRAGPQLERYGYG